MRNEQLFSTKTLAGKSRQQVFQTLTQPVTATQLSQKLGMPFDQCNNALLVLQTHKLVRCLNPAATRNHLFWLTRLGKKFQRHLNNGACLSHAVPDIDWGLYASVCFSQRSEVVKTLTYPMQPSDAAFANQAAGCVSDFGSEDELEQYEGRDPVFEKTWHRSFGGA